MRLGGPIFDRNLSADGWAAAIRALGYGAAYCPVSADADEATIRAFRQAADRSGIVIAEVGAWSNPISPDPAVSREAVEKCCRQLALADRIGARCCVNIAGSRGSQWDGPHPDNLKPETFDLTVQVVRNIIDAVKPTRAFYTLETMPWAAPDSADSYVQLIRAIDRPQFAVHLDPVNLVNCPTRYYRTGDLIRECFAKLGPHIRSCHAKDIVLSGKLTVHLDECRPGTGGLDYAAYLGELNKLHPDTPLMMEHMKTPDDYQLAAEHIRKVAAAQGVRIVN